MNRTKLMYYLSFLSLTCLLTHSLTRCLLAVEIHPNAGTTSASFLKLGVGSRAVGMGGAFVALSDDLTALYWNPAGLLQLKRPEFHVTHNESFEGIRHDFLGYGIPVAGGILASAYYGLYTPEDLERRSGLNENDPFEPLSPIEGLFRAYDIAMHFSYARQIAPRLSGGGSVKFIQQTIDEDSAFGAGIDLGLLYAFEGRPLTLGLAVQNIGTPIKFREKGYALPFIARAGAAYRWSKRIVTTLDVNAPTDNFVSVSAGTEYTPVNFLSLRAGYRYRFHGLELGDISGLAAGIGFNFPIASLQSRLDYAFTPAGVLGDSHRVSMSIIFDSSSPKPRAYPAHTSAHKQKAESRASPRLPEEPAPAPSLSGEDDDGYAYFPLKMTVRRKIAAGHMSIYSVRGESGACRVQYIEGDTGFANAGRLAIRVGEKKDATGHGATIIFKKNLPAHLQRVSIGLKLPREGKKIVVSTEDGAVIGTEKVSEDEHHGYYRVTLGDLRSFRLDTTE